MIFTHAFGTLEAWDGVWYRYIAVHGYILVPGHQSDPAFFPLYPLLLKIVGVTGIATGVAGIFLSMIFFLGALLAFDALGVELVGPPLARRATLLLAVFPTSYVCSMVYPESLVLLAFALAGLFAVRHHWLRCAAFAALAGLARPEGVLLLLPIGGYVAARWRGLPAEERGRALAAALAAPAAALSYVLYLAWALHNPFAWSDAQQAWGRSFRVDGLWHALTHSSRNLLENPWQWRDVALCVLTLLLVAAARRVGVPWGWIALGALMVLLPLGSGSFESDGRFGLLALPAYWGLAWVSRHGRAFVPLVVVSAALLAAATVTLPLVLP